MLVLYKIQNNISQHHENSLQMSLVCVYGGGGKYPTKCTLSTTRTIQYY